MRTLGNVFLSLRGKFLLLGALVAGCSSSGAPGAPGAGETVSTLSEELMSSTTLVQALSGKIVPAVGPVSAPSIGTASVGADGASSYSVPIWVPDGVNGVRPSLSIAYNSRGGFGILGKRWNISGLSSIARCQKTRAMDGVPGPIDYLNGDEFCLDGMRLIRFSGAPFSHGSAATPDSCGAGEFRLPSDPTRRIVVDQCSDLKGIQSFKLFEGNGMISFYGRTPQSRLQGQALDPKRPEIFGGAPAIDAIHGWYVDKVEDRFGNSYLIEYKTGAASNIEMLLPVPAKITWGGVGDTPGKRSVTFDYLPFDVNDRTHQSWVKGMAIIAGQRLATLSVAGPDATGAPVLLKQYRFNYRQGSEALTITGEPLLHDFVECDNNNVCNRGTNVNWESGSNNYTKTNLTAAGVADVGLANMPPNISNQFAAPADVPFLYRRILPADLNSDGMDDVVYRAPVPTQSGSTTCLGWLARLSSGTSFGPPIALPDWVNQDSDSGCVTGARPRFEVPTSSDLILADLNRDDYVDIIASAGGALVAVPVNPVNSIYVPTQSYYDTFLHDRSPAPTFQAFAVDLDRPVDERAQSKLDIGIADLDGDGILEMIRPASGSPPRSGVLWAKSMVPDGREVPIPDVPGMTTLLGISTLDVDGDGVSEVLRDAVGCGQPPCPPNPTYAVSQTMNLLMNVPRQNPPEEGAVDSLRLLLDLNGDGLLDLAEVKASAPDRIETRLATGLGFYQIVQSTSFPAGAQVGQSWVGGMYKPILEAGIRIADMNRDGRQDLVLVDNGATSTGTATRSQVTILLSKGDGTFSLYSPAAGLTPVKIGDPADGNFAGLATLPFARRGYRTSVVLDLNGDASPDFLQFEGGKLYSYVRSGKAPDLVNSIVEVGGKTVSFSYAPLSDRSVYTVNHAYCDADPEHLSCLTRGEVVTSRMAFSVDGLNEAATSYKYDTGIVDHGGNGFLGFEVRHIYGPEPTRHETIYSDVGQVDALTNEGGQIYHYDCPGAFRPVADMVEIDAVVPGTTNTHHQDTTTYVYEPYRPYFPDGNTNYALNVPLTHVIARKLDCPGPGPCTPSNTRALGMTMVETAYDDYNNVLASDVVHLDPTDAVVESDHQGIGYYPVDVQNWLISVPMLRDETSFAASTGTSLTKSRVYDAEVLTANPVTLHPTGAIKREHVVAGGRDYLTRTFGRDTRGRVTSTEERDAATAETRTTGYRYEDADGVYVTSTVNALGHVSRTWRHPGLGVTVEQDDPNGVATTTSYDSFLRPVSSTAAGGALVETRTYATTAVSGSDLTITPEGKATRAISVHLDARGNETTRAMRVDATRKIVTVRSFDSLNRLTQTLFASSDGTTSTLLNTETRSYDNLGRLLSVSRLPATDPPTATPATKTFTFDGLLLTTKDESGLKTNERTDVLGHVVEQTAVLRNGTSTATYVYGPFGALSHYQTDDGTASTDIGYDALGRESSFSQKHVGTKTTEYNGFGDAMLITKTDVAGQNPVRTTYVRDLLGRVTVLYTRDGRPPGTRRQFTWDTFANGSVMPGGIGHLNFVVENGLNNTLRFTYDANGLLASKIWRLGNGSQSSPLETYTISRTYDGLGRVDTLTFPTSPTETTPLTVKYAYDDYTGAAKTITDTANPATPIWSATAKSIRGQITSESMRLPGTSSTVTRTSNFFPQDGSLKDVTLLGANGQQAKEAYTYLADGLPLSFGMTGTGLTAWTETYGYDNLQRLVNWTPAGGAPLVTYGYDSGGALVSRSWSGETATFGVQHTPAGQPDATNGTVRLDISRGTQPSLTELYSFDNFGRVSSTPSVDVTMGDDDLMRTVTEKSSGQTNTLLYDGTGERIITLYGTNGSAGSLISLDGVFELKRDGALTIGTTESRCRLSADGRVIGDVVRTGTGARSATYYLENAVHSVVAEASSSGIVSSRARRDPFGNALVNAAQPFLAADPGGTNPDGTSRLGFGGHEREANWGLVDMLARSYSPRIGRFTSADPVMAHPLDRRDHNPFAYAWDSPTQHDDPSGKTVGQGRVLLPPRRHAARQARLDAEADYYMALAIFAQIVQADVWTPFTPGKQLAIARSGVDASGVGYTSYVVFPIGAGFGTSLSASDLQPPLANGETLDSALTSLLSQAGVSGRNISFPEAFDAADYADFLRSGPHTGLLLADDRPARPWRAAGFAVGVSGELDFILPFLPEGGGTIGLNVEYTSDHGLQLFGYKTPKGQVSDGVAVGASVSLSFAGGNGYWTGIFENFQGSAGPVAAGVFKSPTLDENGYVGASVGLSLGPPGLGYTPTDYTCLAGCGATK